MRNNKTVMLAVMLAAMATGGYYLLLPASTSMAYANERNESDKAYEQLKTATNLSEAFKHVASALRPSVVSISTRNKPRASAVRQFRMPHVPFGSQPFDEDLAPFFREFGVPLQSPERKGLGTGIIIRQDGHILTNHHVVKGADEIQVTLSDDKVFDASVVGLDIESDLAVLKIDQDDLQPIKWGHSDQATVGEWVVAIGSPFGLDQTVTAGIISATGRNDVGITSYEDFLQTDAAINPGNSGGPLVNLRGELIGVNTAIASRSGTYNGIGFAIPSDMAQRITDNILDYGRVDRGYLGVTIQDLDEGLASSFGYAGTDGVLIGDVVAGGPAENAGLQAGDIITHVDDTEVSDSRELRHRIADSRPGTEIQLSCFRQGMPLMQTVTLDVRDVTQVATTLPNETSIENAESNALGLQVRPLTSDQVRSMNLDVDQGLVVVRSSGLARRAGIRNGDVIVSIDGNSIETMADFLSATQSSKVSEGVRLHINRNGMSQFVYMRAG